MNYNNAIAKADDLRLNVVSDEQKTKWIYELECRIADMMGVEAPAWEFPCERELMLPVQHDDVYVKYLVAMIDFFSGENDQYANDITVFEHAYEEACSWWIRNHRPASSGNWRV